MDDGSPSLFIHLPVYATGTSLVASLCPLCHKWLGASPNNSLLRVVERAHCCEDRGATEVQLPVR
jgi:hypothetical protein